MFDSSTNSRSTLAVIVLSGLVASSPLLVIRPPWYGLWIVATIIPYSLILTKNVRDPRDRSGNALALGVSAMMMTVGVLLVFVQRGRQEALPLVFAVALSAVHVLLGYLAAGCYRQGVSNKPHWRLLLRGFLEPLIYYSILFIIAGGASLHLD